MLGDPWSTDPTLNPSSDPGSFTPVQANYYRAKIIEFQILLQTLDQSAQHAQSLIDANISESLSNDLRGMLNNFDAKKYAFRAAAESLNFAVNGMNQFGAEFPTVEIPQGLAAVPVVALAAVLGVTATLIVWGRSWLEGYSQRLARAQQLDAISDPDKREQLAMALAQSDAALQQAESSPLGSVAQIVKWSVIAVGLYFAYKAISDKRAALA